MFLRSNNEFKFGFIFNLKEEPVFVNQPFTGIVWGRMKCTVLHMCECLLESQGGREREREREWHIRPEGASLLESLAFLPLSPPLPLSPKLSFIQSQGRSKDKWRAEHPTAASVRGSKVPAP